MPIVDSTYIVKDSLFLSENSDVVAESNFSTDLLQISDSSMLRSSSGFEGEPHPSSPASEDWVFGSILFFFLLLTLSFLRSSHWILESVRTFFKVKKRSSLFSKTTMNDFQSRLFLVIFSLGVMSLFVFAALSETANEFRFIDYIVLFGISLIFFGLKYLIAKIIGYVFTDKTSIKLAIGSYLNTLTYLGVIQFPLLIFFIYSNEKIQLICLYLSLFFMILVTIILTVKLFQIFFDKIVVSFYILLYLCTLEIIPFIFLFWLFRIIVLDV